MLEFVKNNGTITRAEVEAQFGISASTASRLLKRMVEKDLLVQHGKSRNIKYIISD